MCRPMTPLQPTGEGEEGGGGVGFKALKRSCHLNMHPPKQIITYKNKELKVR